MERGFRDGMKKLNGFSVSDIDTAVDRVSGGWREFDGGNLFVTGGTGFFGQWILAVVLRACDVGRVDLRVTVLTRDASRARRKLPELLSHPKITLLEGDVRSFPFPKGGFTHVIHAATDTSTDADADPLNLMETIVDGTKRVLHFAQMGGVRKVLFVSSGAVYGPQPDEMNRLPETYLGACPTDDRRSNYGQSKRLAEQLCTVFFHEYGLETVIARCFAFVGPGMALNGHFAIGNFIQDAVEGRNIRVRGDGRAVRSYLYAADLVVWLLRILVDGVPCRPYNVGSDQAIQIAELAERVRMAIGASGEMVVEGVLSANPARNRYVPDITVAREELGLEVWTDLDEAIRKTALWYTERRTDRPEPGQKESGEREANAPKTFVLDIDGVIAGLTEDNDYSKAPPLLHTIHAINTLYAQGHRIILFTARGSMTGIDWEETTRRQLKQWGLRYHELHFGKPAADFYVDDRLLSVGELHKMAFRYGVH